MYVYISIILPVIPPPGAPETGGGPPRGPPPPLTSTPPFDPLRRLCRRSEAESIPHRAPKGTPTPKQQSFYEKSPQRVIFGENKAPGGNADTEATELCFGNYFGTTKGHFCDHLGIILGPFWDYFGINF